jgi:glutamate synthase (NADPH/NADH) small chain
MADAKGFMKIHRRDAPYRPIAERVADYRAVARPKTERENREQAARCMDCGTPFCSWACPISNDIPEWNDLADEGNWPRAFALLDEHHIIPEVTGRVCPAPCEHGCVLAITDDPVTIKDNELAVVERAFEEGLVEPRPPKRETSPWKVAVIGSGPAGLVCATALNRMGYLVTVFERDERPGGILRYGIPDFKLEKWVLDRRIELWQREGIEFATGIAAGEDIAAQQLLERFDAVCLAGGARKPRDLPIEGRTLEGIHFAMDFLSQSNRRVSGEQTAATVIDAENKNVVVIGGGDTGADCIGTTRRQGAKKIVQIELLPKPPESRSVDQPWPVYPKILKIQSSHEEGVERLWSVNERRFMGSHGRVTGLSCVEVSFERQNGKPSMSEIPGTDFQLEADLVLLAMGFVGAEPSSLLSDLNIRLTERGTVKTDKTYMTSQEGVFAAGDMRRGQSLVVWACREGKEAAKGMDRYLRQKSG